MRVFTIILICVFQSCTTKDNQTAEVFVNQPRFDISMLKGTWQCCEKYGGYTLIEFSDSVYQFQEYEEGGYYGALYPYSYQMISDSLVFTSDETWSNPKWVIKSLDSFQITLANKYDTIVCKRVNLDLPLKQYRSQSNSEKYQHQFLMLRSQFNCP